MTLADAHGGISVTPVLVQMLKAAKDLEEHSAVLKGLFRTNKNQLALRAELMLEELAELLEAMVARDEVRSLDAIADLLYVTYGTAVTFRLPATSGFWEAHTSNMTKGAQAANHSGDRGKGEGYKPARFDLVLMAHRAQEEEEANQQKIKFGDTNAG